MKKRTLIVLAIIMSALMVFMVAGCNRVRTSKDYNLYQYDDIIGGFVEQAAKITFDKDDYTRYNNAGRVVDMGEHSTNDRIVSFVPSNIGDANPMLVVDSFYVYKEFMIPTNAFVAGNMFTQESLIRFMVISLIWKVFMI